MIAEQFAEIQIFVPFPAKIPKISAELELITDQIRFIKNQKNMGCQFLHNTVNNFNSKHEEWLLKYVTKEHATMLNDIKVIQTELTQLLGTHTQDNSNSQSREKLFAGIILAGAAVASLGLGLGIGSKLRCGLTGILGSCPALGKQNRENIKLAVDDINLIHHTIRQIEQVNNAKMFLVASTLAQIIKTQNDTIAVQNKNWSTMKHQLAIIQNNTFVYAHCEQSTYMRAQLQQQSMHISSILHTLLDNIRAYQSALHVFRNTILQSITAIVNNHIPISLLPPQDLTDVLHKFVNTHDYQQQRLTLALPLTDILTYYETKLLTAVHTNELGLFFVIAVPLVTQNMVMNVFSATAVPLTYPDMDHALIWNLETPYLAVSDMHAEIATISQRTLDTCIGSKAVKICYEAFATDMTKRYVR